MANFFRLDENNISSAVKAAERQIGRHHKGDTYQVFMVGYDWDYNEGEFYRKEVDSLSSAFKKALEDIRRQYEWRGDRCPAYIRPVGRGLLIRVGHYGALSVVMAPKSDDLGDRPLTQGSESTETTPRWIQMLPSGRYAAAYEAYWKAQ